VVGRTVALILRAMLILGMLEVCHPRQICAVGLSFFILD
jgi:hypothetical protein